MSLKPAAERFRVMAYEDAEKLLGWEPRRPSICSPGWVVVEFPSDGPPMFLFEDGGAPEDQSLVRDWKWVTPALNAAFEAGRQAGREAGFAEAIDAAAYLARTWWMADDLENRIRALTCPPAADGSEGSDGE